MLIASFCDILSYLPCSQVCQLWHDVFMPLFWKTVDDSKAPWTRLLQPQGTDDPNLLEPPRLTHPHHIRHLVIAERWLLSASISSDITNLESLVIVGLFDNSSYPGTKCLLDETPSIVTVPATIFKAPTAMQTWLQKRRQLARSQLCWQLIFNNPRLRSIEFKDTIPPTALRPFRSTPADTKRESYPLGALLALTQLGPPSELDHSVFNACTTIRILTIHNDIKASYLRSIFKPFSGLRELIFDGEVDHDRTGMDSADEIIHNTSLDSLTTSCFGSIIGARIQLDGLTKMGLSDATYSQLRLALGVLPALRGLMLSKYDSLGFGMDGEDPNTPKQGSRVRIFSCRNNLKAAGLANLVRSMLHLTRLELVNVTADIVVELSRSCKNLEWA
ncbi:hypothetical protein BGX33_007444 [Mortierella sp. NVP41]|nr:hypothetical protein BGX33_007444 [Mortierella sp. NVP41]